MTRPSAHSTDLRVHVKRENCGAQPASANSGLVATFATGLRWYNAEMPVANKMQPNADCRTWLVDVGRAALVATLAALMGCATASITSSDARTADVDSNDTVDATLRDAAVVVDAAVDAACVPVWSNILGNGDFENAVLPWTQAPTIIRTAAQKPFAPQAGTYAALFGVSNNGNGTLTQSVVIPAAAQGLRMRGFNCFVTEDLSADADRMVVSLENAGGTVVESLLNVTNSNVAATCAWAPFTYVATSAHAGDTLLLRLHGTTNATLLTRFAFDELAVEALACP